MHLKIFLKGGLWHGHHHHSVCCWSAIRSIYTSPTILKYKVDKASLSKLRKKTGIAFSNCKKALEKFEGDFVKAEGWLREEAQKQGWAKATQLEGRSTSHGLIGILHKANTVAMVEVNCETDFVARNSKFQNLVAQVAGVCLDHVQTMPQNKILWEASELNALKAEGKSLSDLVAMEVSHIGENLIVRRAAGVKVTGGDHLGSYVHASGPEVKNFNCQMGKYGAVVVFSQSSAAETSSERYIGDFGRQLSQHIVGMNPEEIGQDSDEPHDDIEEETKLIFQEFMLDSEKRVKGVLDENGVLVKDFIRYQCGETSYMQ